ncbi:MAG: GTPase ObgE [bacterium]|nr:GTPase ObgE [bacterium]
MFLDEAIIDVSGGNGGNGCVSWRREKFIPRGGPDGGDGGRGANIYMIANCNTDTLSDFASRKVYKAEPGQAGAGQRKKGRSGEDLFLQVPPGTLICYDDGKIIGDLCNHKDQVLIAKGGRGGFGNAHFKSSTRQTPDFAEKGEPSEKKKIHLELKLVADVGIIGYPSVGKSTLISVISSAKPKIADYEFTTLVPNLGVVSVDDRSYVVCDVPGLIEGASSGKGLGHQFLKHIERCGILVHILDVQRALISGSLDMDQLVFDYKTIRSELEKFSPALMQRDELVVINKIDLAPDRVDEIVSFLTGKGIVVFGAISNATTEGVEEFKTRLLPIVLRKRTDRKNVVEEESIAVLQPHLETNAMGSYRIESEKDVVRVFGKRIEQLTSMTEFESEGGVRRFRDICDRIGLKHAIRHEIKDSDRRVLIGNIDVTEYIF